MTVSADDGALPTAKITSLPTAMTAAACLGIAWYLCAELNVRLLIRCTRRSLYFWSCLLCSWGITMHLIAIRLANFNIWKDYSAIVIIHITWCIYINAQSIVLYSRLNLVLKNDSVRHGVLYLIIFTSVAFGLTTAVLGMVARHPKMITKLGNANLIWDRIQVAVFFVQETLISALYIRETSLHLKNMTLLGIERKTTRKLLRHLIYVNIFIIALDCSLIGLCYSGFFFLQGFYKAAVYAVKLRTEFTILNQLRSSLPGASTSGQGSEYTGAYGRSGHGNTNGNRRSGVRVPARQAQSARVQGSQDSDVEMVVMAEREREAEVHRSGKEGGSSVGTKDGRTEVEVEVVRY